MAYSGVILRRLLLFSIVLLGTHARAFGQAPFATDDAGVSAARRWHMELFLVQSDLLESDLPAQGQTTFIASTAYGLFGWLELGVDAPWIAVDQVGEADYSGLGDINLSAKFRLRETSGGLWPAVAVSAAIESPTGDEDKGLGSGVLDYGLNLVGDWTLAPSSFLRANLGILFAGNSLTGVVGLESDGEIVAASLSFTQVLSERWEAGIEVRRAEGQGAASNEQDLIAQAGARFALNDKVTLAAGVVHGWYVAPEWQVQIGAIVDP